MKRKEKNEKVPFDIMETNNKQWLHFIYDTKDDLSSLVMGLSVYVFVYVCVSEKKFLEICYQ